MSIEIFNWNEYPIKNNNYFFTLIIGSENKEIIKKDLLKIYPNKIIDDIPNNNENIKDKCTLILKNKINWDDICNIESCYIKNKPLKIIYFEDNYKKLNKTLLTLSTIIIFLNKNDCIEYLKERQFFSISNIDSNIYLIIDKRIIKGNNLKYIKKDQKIY